MNKKLMIAGSIFAVALGLGLGAVAVSAADALKAPQAELTIAGKKPAHFSHPPHLKLGMACGVCHHDGEHKPLSAEAIAALPNAKQLSCVGCHNGAFTNPDLQKVKDVFHARCKECHKAGYEGKKGPGGCIDCHIKQEKKAAEGC